METSTRTAIVLLGLAFIVAACQGPRTQAEQAARDSAIARATKGKLLFEEKCRTVAGEKIYRTVLDVDGVLLLKVRQRANESNWADLMWPGAAFALEATGDEYITTFLGYEHSSSPTGKPVTAEYRGYIGTDYQPNNPSNLPGYSFVDVIDGSDGKRYRYVGRWEEPWIRDKSYLKGYIKFFLDKKLANTPAPRYAVTFEDRVVAEERVLGVASSTVRVLDASTGEVLGELIRYAWTPSGPNSANPSPWLSAYKCPGQAVGASAATRKFVDQVLIPRGR